MSLNMCRHIRQSVLKTALVHLLKNGRKSPERTTRNILELLLKFEPVSDGFFNYASLLSLIKNQPWEECLDSILENLP